MDSLPQWDALSEAARSQLMAGVHAMLAAEARCMASADNDAAWHELLAAGVVQITPDLGGFHLTGPGACLVLDAMQDNLTTPVPLAA